MPTVQGNGFELSDFQIAPDSENEDDLSSSSLESISNLTITDSDWTTETILSQLAKGNIQLDPKFQRRDAWGDERKSRFIESIFVGLPIPQIVLAESRTRRGTYIVIDGKQRLLALQKFAVQDNSGQSPALRLRGLVLLKTLNGYTLEEIAANPSLSPQLSAFENQTIRTTVIRRWESEELLYLIFYRLNSGSLPLSPQELRHVLHPGPFVDFVFERSGASATLAAMLGNDGKPDFRMRDVELLIRFFSYQFFLSMYTGDLKRFLDSTCEQLNSNWASSKGSGQPTYSEKVQELAVEFDEAANLTIEIFGDSAFRKWTPPSYERRFNRAVFDVMMYFFADRAIREKARNRKAEIEVAFKELCSSDQEFRKYLEVTTKSQNATLGRIDKWALALGDAIGLKLERRS